jgi:hypothetical protein
LYKQECQLSHIGQTLLNAQPAKKCSTFYGAQRFIIMFMRAYKLSVAWAKLNKSTPDFFKINFNVIFPHTFGSSEWSLPSGFWPKLCPHFTSLICMLQALLLLSSLTCHPNTVILGKEYKVWSSSLCSLLSLPPSHSPGHLVLVTQECASTQQT